MGKQRLVGQSIDRDTRDRADRQGEQQPERQAAGGVGRHHRHVGAEREDAGMSDVQDAQQAINQRQAHRHHRVHAAVDEALDRQLDEKHR